MTKLSICIPIEPGMTPPLHLCERLLSDREADIEIVVAPYASAFEADHPLMLLAANDRRLRFLPPAPDGISLSNLWMGTAAGVYGQWLTILRPDDMLEPGLDTLLRHVETTSPETDAVAWNTFTIDPAASRNIATAVGVPIQHHVMEMDRSDMLEAFFYWKGSSNVPRMPFGLYHGAIRRELLERILSHSGELSWLTTAPQYEWSARVLIHAQKFAFCARPLSAISQLPYQPVAIPRVISNMPFNAMQGITGAIAEIQCRVMHEMGNGWEGYDDNFIRACMIDCMLENRRDVFDAKANAYHAAMVEMGNQRLTSSFQPPYLEEPKADRRRGLHGHVMLVDRFLGNATTAQEFYDLARYMLTPLDVAVKLSSPDSVLH